MERKVLSHVNLFGMQSEEYADRIRGLGVESMRIKTLGNFKFDSKPSSRIPEWATKINGPVITAGSTHEGEEELTASLYMELKKDFPELNLIIAPRHPERFKSVEEMLSSKRVPFMKRSAFGNQMSQSPVIKGQRNPSGHSGRTVVSLRYNRYCNYRKEFQRPWRAEPP